MSEEYLKYHNKKLSTDPAYANRFNNFMASKMYQKMNPNSFGGQEVYPMLDKNLTVSPAQVDSYADNPAEESMFGGMNKAIAQGYQQKANQAMSNPNEKPYWYRQADQMMRSGNPVLMKQAQDIMGKAQTAAFAKPTSNMSNSAKIAADLGLVQGTAEFNDFVRKHAMKTNYDKTIKSSDALLMRNKNNQHPPIGMTYDQAANAGFKYEKKTQKQETAESYTHRMSSLMDELAELEPKDGSEPTFIRDQLAELIPFAGNFFMSGKGQRLRNLRKDWIMANVRDESGAAIGKEEVGNYVDTYFAKSGDKPSVIQQKKQLRETAVESMRIKSGQKLPTTEAGPEPGMTWE